MLFSTFVGSRSLLFSSTEAVETKLSIKRGANHTLAAAKPLGLGFEPHQRCVVDRQPMLMQHAPITITLNAGIYEFILR